MKIKLRHVLIGILDLSMLVVIGYVRFSNPHLTETQLFLEYWELWTGMLVGIFITYFIMEAK